MRCRGRHAGVAICTVVLLLSAGCTRRQLAPGIVAGSGALLMTSGGIYRATLETDEAFGDTPGEIAGTTILIFGGLGLLLTGVIWSLTSSHCEDNGDCWSSDVCELRTHTCIDGDAARRLQSSSGQQEDDDSEESDGDESVEESTTEDDGERDEGGEDSTESDLADEPDTIDEPEEPSADNMEEE